MASAGTSPVSIIWDYHSTPIPSGYSALFVTNQLTQIVKPLGPIKCLSTFGNSQSTPLQLVQDLHFSGAKFMDLGPTTWKQVAAILTELFVFAIDNPPPATIVMVTSDLNYANALSILKLRGYQIVLVTPKAASSNLEFIAHQLIEWESIFNDPTSLVKMYPSPWLLDSPAKSFAAAQTSNQQTNQNTADISSPNTPAIQNKSQQTNVTAKMAVQSPGIDLYNKTPSKNTPITTNTTSSSSTPVVNNTSSTSSTSTKIANNSQNSSSSSSNAALPPASLSNGSSSSVAPASLSSSTTTTTSSPSPTPTPVPSSKPQSSASLSSDKKASTNSSSTNTTASSTAKSNSSVGNSSPVPVSASTASPANGSTSVTNTPSTPSSLAARFSLKSPIPVYTPSATSGTTKTADSTPTALSTPKAVASKPSSDSAATNPKSAASDASTVTASKSVDPKPSSTDSSTSTSSSPMIMKAGSISISQFFKVCQKINSKEVRSSLIADLLQEAYPKLYSSASLGPLLEHGVKAGWFQTKGSSGEMLVEFNKSAMEKAKKQLRMQII